MGAEYCSLHGYVSQFTCSGDSALGCFQFGEILMKAYINRFHHFYICLQSVLFFEIK